jgi:hypothetical protein
VSRHGNHPTVSDRGLLVALAICCAGPMVLIVVLTSVAGVALGPAAAVSLGLVAAGVCVAVMVQRHRGHPEHRTPDGAGSQTSHRHDHPGG